jgi:hypothetical protein
MLQPIEATGGSLDARGRRSAAGTAAIAGGGGVESSVAKRRSSRTRSKGASRHSPYSPSGRWRVASSTAWWASGHRAGDGERAED